MPDLSREEDQGEPNVLARVVHSQVDTDVQCDETKPTCVRCSHGQREVRVSSRQTRRARV